jgi:segregation and condensation protein B
MSEIENEPMKSPLADQLEALSAENESTKEVSGADVSADVTTDAEIDTEIEFTDDAQDATPSALAASLEALSEQVSVQEPNLDFVENLDNPISENPVLENPMMVGEAEQLPMLGLEEAAAEIEEEGIPDEPTEFIDHDKLVSIVESLLFSTDKPVSLATFKALFKGSNIRTKDIMRALDQLASSYAAAERGVTLEEIHGGYQLRTKVDNTEYLRRLAKVRPFRLSGPALEVLAIAAYKQPITKTEVDQIRGVESGHLMRALMERGMVGFGEKSDLPGRPMTYVTTRKFLETFGLRNLKELPTLAEIDDLLPEGIGGEEEKETLSDLTSAMSNEVSSSYSVGEEELQDISESLKVIDTTSEFFEQEKVRQRVERDRDRAQDIRERITVGEDVEDKDRRWLARYEAKQEQMAQAEQAGEATGPLVVEDEAEGTQDSQSLAGALSALSAETSENLAESEQPESEEEMVDELSAKPDFSEDDMFQEDEK